MSLNEPKTQVCVTLHILSAFTDGHIGGNPAGVVLDAGDLDEAQMQAIATQAGLSETAFVSAVADGGFRLDFFTPNRRIADCGHATVAAFALLHQLGRVGVGETFKELADGRRKILIAPDGAIFMAMGAPRYLHSQAWSGVTVEQLLAALGLAREQLDPRVEPVLADAGGPFITVPVRTQDDLAALQPDQAAILRISDQLALTGLYVYALDPAPDRVATARMFAPRYGIPEESATGMAAGALGAVLYDFAGRAGPDFLIEQGRHMTPASPSRLRVQLDLTEGRISGITTGGRGLLRAARCISLDGPETTHD